MLFRVLTLSLVILFAARAEAHLVLDRRPLDAIVARSESMLVAEAVQGTKAAGTLRVTAFRAVTCLAGPCPNGPFQAAGLDDHAAEFSHGKRYLIGLAAQPAILPDGTKTRFRVVQNAWEAREFEPGRLEELRKFVPLYARLLKMTPDERERAYLDALSAQLEAADAALREDALRSLLLFPEGRVTAAAKARVLDRVYAEPRDNIRAGLLALANAWDAGALRKRLARGRDGFGDVALARALFVLGAGNAAEAAQPCLYLDAKPKGVRAAAFEACMPPGGDWIAVVAPAVHDPDAGVRTAARDRLRRAGKPALTAWALSREPWWRRVYFRATGRAPMIVTQIFPESR